MKTIELKSSAHQLIDSINDNKILQSILAYISLAKGEKKTELWNELSDTQKAAIEEGIAQLNRGEGIPHEEVMQSVRAKYNLPK